MAKDRSEVDRELADLPPELRWREWMRWAKRGRAFLREDGTGWKVILLSGESPRHAAAFRTLGLNPRAAARLAEALALAEARGNEACSLRRLSGHTDAR
ncbi:hypothetical protein BV394_15010 (plasmid) [Brevirhabdus pacifica]|uniref:Uncharacterized protein n=1 Tax=Brevirhabdus pacifica TaxID=1267768 RepID=A0A1P8QXY9_9RHOB|nr:hypothetical protein BV394_15010 [Brevirhabdus pacifica]OWU74128.1 hypothetical protein ATO5_15410 [Loktanella sp. 22II-4b]